METKVLIISVIKKGEAILMRKKAPGQPYSETWYIFGAELKYNVDPDDIIKTDALTKAGINVKVTSRSSWDTEIKKDVDGIEKFFVYLDVICEYIDGELTPGPGIEDIAWVLPEDIEKYDIVPPSRVLFKKLGYIK